MPLRNRKSFHISDSMKMEGSGSQVVPNCASPGVRLTTTRRAMISRMRASLNADVSPCASYQMKKPMLRIAANIATSCSSVTFDRARDTIPPRRLTATGTARTSLGRGVITVEAAATSPYRVLDHRSLYAAGLCVGRAFDVRAVEGERG